MLMPVAVHAKANASHTAAVNARVVDLCCGMGGLSVAAREMGMRVVAGVDVNPSALRTFVRNFSEAEAIEGSVQSRTVLKRCSVVGVWCSNSANHGRVRMNDHRQLNPDNCNRMPPGTGPMSYRRRHPVRPANMFFSGHRAPTAHFNEPRSITVRKAARLQGFPDTFRAYGTFANQMEQVTNAVPPPLTRTCRTRWECVAMPQENERMPGTAPACPLLSPAARGGSARLTGCTAGVTFSADLYGMNRNSTIRGDAHE